MLPSGGAFVRSFSFFLSPADLDSLLTTLKSLGGEDEGEREGREEGTGLRLLEQMLQSNTFKRAQKVYTGAFSTC